MRNTCETCRRWEAGNFRCSRHNDTVSGVKHECGVWGTNTNPFCTYGDDTCPAYEPMPELEVYSWG